MEDLNQGSYCEDDYVPISVLKEKCPDISTIALGAMLGIAKHPKLKIRQNRNLWLKYGVDELVASYRSRMPRYDKTLLTTRKKRIKKDGKGLPPLDAFRIVAQEFKKQSDMFWG